MLSACGCKHRRHKAGCSARKRGGNESRGERVRERERETDRERERERDTEGERDRQITVRAEIIAELILERAGPIIFKTF